jgi:hypothetical protein
MYNMMSNRYQVRFEDKSLKPALVKLANIRIVINPPRIMNESFHKVRLAKLQP